MSAVTAWFNFLPTIAGSSVCIFAILISIAHFAFHLSVLRIAVASFLLPLSRALINVFVSRTNIFQITQKNYMHLVNYIPLKHCPKIDKYAYISLLCCSHYRHLTFKINMPKQGAGTANHQRYLSLYRHRVTALRCYCYGGWIFVCCCFFVPRLVLSDTKMRSRGRYTGNIAPNHRHVTPQSSI